MKILYLSSTPIKYSKRGNLYNGCGWMASLIDNISICQNVEVAVSYFVRDNSIQHWKERNISYYPLRDPLQSRWDIITGFFRNKHNLDMCKVEQVLSVVNDFAPDIIHIFGTEDVFGLISEHCNVPVVIHIQGILNPYLNAFLAPGINWSDYPHIALNLKHYLFRLADKKDWEYRCEREKRIYKATKYYMGRTFWDKSVTLLFNKNAVYFKCWEILRGEFYNQTRHEDNSTFTIISTISNASYKGYDLVLKTAKLLKEQTQLNFDWKVYGGVNERFFEKNYKIKGDNVNVHIQGVASAATISDELNRASLYVHPSYIDNSPNSLCEAMISGCPVIATNVGGISSLIEHEHNGLLCPANDPYILATYILVLANNKEMANNYAKNAKETAEVRHNPKMICENVYNIYKKIISYEDSE